MIKSLFNSQEDWAFDEKFIQNLAKIAKLRGINEEQFDQCLANQSLQEEILKSRIKAVEDVNVQSTPTFIINNELISGYRSWERIENLIKKNLDK